jgi:hypothetical protein
MSQKCKGRKSQTKKKVHRQMPYLLELDTPIPGKDLRYNVCLHFSLITTLISDPVTE